MEHDGEEGDENVQASLQRKRLKAVNIGRKPAMRKLPSETKKEKKQKPAICEWSMTEKRETKTCKQACKGIV
jgi:hypothetical protein